MILKCHPKILKWHKWYPSDIKMVQLAVQRIAGRQKAIGWGPTFSLQHQPWRWTLAINQNEDDDDRMMMGMMIIIIVQGYNLKQATFPLQHQAWTHPINRLSLWGEDDNGDDNVSNHDYVDKPDNHAWWSKSQTLFPCNTKHGLDIHGPSLFISMRNEDEDATPTHPSHQSNYNQDQDNDWRRRNSRILGSIPEYRG